MHKVLAHPKQGSLVKKMLVSKAFWISVPWAETRGKCFSESSSIRILQEFGFHPEKCWESERIISQE